MAQGAGMRKALLFAVAAAFNTVYGGTKAFTGPTVSGCAVEGATLRVKYNATLLRGDTVALNAYVLPYYYPYYFCDLL